MLPKSTHVTLIGKLVVVLVPSFWISRPLAVVPALFPAVPAKQKFALDKAVEKLIVYLPVAVSVMLLTL